MFVLGVGFRLHHRLVHGLSDVLFVVHEAVLSIHGVQDLFSELLLDNRAFLVLWTSQRVLDVVLLHDADQLLLLLAVLYQVVVMPLVLFLENVFVLKSVSPIALADQILEFSSAFVVNLIGLRFDVVSNIFQVMVNDLGFKIEQRVNDFPGPDLGPVRFEQFVEISGRAGASRGLIAGPYHLHVNQRIHYYFSFRNYNNNLASI